MHRKGKKRDRKTKGTKPRTHDPLAKLTPEERAELEAREQAILDHAGDRVRIGEELLAIRAGKLHKKIGYASIEKYAAMRFRGRIGTSRAHINRYITAARVREKIKTSPFGDILGSLPEGPLRDMGKLIGDPIGFDVAAKELGLMVNRSNEEAQKAGVEAKPITGTQVEQVVKDVMRDRLVRRERILPPDTDALQECFHVANVEDGLPFVGIGTVDFSFMSFPYGCGIHYPKFNDDIPLSDLLDWYERWLVALCPLHNPKWGRIGINVADIYARRSPDEVAYLDMEVDAIIERSTDFKRMGRHYWFKGRGNGMSGTTYGSVGSYSAPNTERVVEHVLVYHRGKRQREHEAGRADTAIGNYMAWRKNQWEGEDVKITEEEIKIFEELYSNRWEVNAASATRTHHIHGAVFPTGLAKRALMLYSAVGDLVLDAFGGSGTTSLMAARLGRRFIYVDNAQEYCDYARKRVVEDPEVRRVMGLTEEAPAKGRKPNRR